MILDDLLGFVLPHVKQCPTATAIFHLRQAVIELCTKALVWREYQAEVLTVDGQPFYAYAPAAGQRVTKLLSATLNSLDVPVIDPRTGKAAAAVRLSSLGYIFGRLDGFELHPVQAAGLPIVTYSAVCPTLASESLPDHFDRYAEQLSRGALARIMMVADQPFSNPAMGKEFGRRFEDDIGDARVEAWRGFARTTPRSVASWF